ncbi:phage minor head protein [Emergencia sp. 1XD21-10]|uniref:phage minor head protein n=1 Tax=Emergencia sp. 1XD21-10 TaxID=2304569 RepID=UPI00137B323F|nr:phage minor head protein [Emergencia sp. 1XD21-10]
MNKKQIEVEKAKLKAEEYMLKRLKAIYGKAAQDITNKLKIINGKISVLLKDFEALDEIQKSILQSQIYQKKYQESLKKQIDTFLKDLASNQYDSIADYMKNGYQTGFIGTMYDLHGQGIPLILPIDQKKVIDAMRHSTNISEKLYKKLGEDVEFLKKRIANNVSRGIASAYEYKHIARNIASDSNVGFNRAMRIARTEGHGVQCRAAWDAQHAAKKAGADVVKQWDATLDARTRDSHALVDGEIRELEEKFSNGMMFPSDPAGGAAEVVNCRCALLQRARWALDDAELKTLQERAGYFGLDKTENFEDFKQRYLKISPLTETDQKSIIDYMGAKSYVINDKLRNYKQLTPEEAKFTIELDSALKKLDTYKGNLSRSLYFMSEEAINSFLAAYSINGMITYKEYLSTTKGEVYNPDGQVQIYIRNSKKGKDISALNPSEAEVIFERGTTFRVIKMVKRNGITHILLEEVDE